MDGFEQIDEARKILMLDECATLEEIKRSYRKLAHKYHPDKHNAKNKKEFEETFKKINRAKDILINYCARYSYSFKKIDVAKNVMGSYSYEHLKRFYDGWWGDLDL